MKTKTPVMQKAWNVFAAMGKLWPSWRRRGGDSPEVFGVRLPKVFATECQAGTSCLVFLRGAVPVRVTSLLPVFSVFRFFGEPLGESFVLKLLRTHRVRGPIPILTCRRAELLS